MNHLCVIQLLCQSDIPQASLSFSLCINFNWPKSHAFFHICRSLKPERTTGLVACLPDRLPRIGKFFTTRGVRSRGSLSGMEKRTSQFWIPVPQRSSLQGVSTGSVNWPIPSRYRSTIRQACWCRLWLGSRASLPENAQLTVKAYCAGSVVMVTHWPCITRYACCGRRD